MPDARRAAADPRRWLAPSPPLVLGALLVAALWSAEVEPRTVGVAMIVLVVVLIVLGLPIAFALFLTGVVGLALVKHDVLIAARTLGLAADGTISEYVFATRAAVRADGLVRERVGHRPRRVPRRAARVRQDLRRARRRDRCGQRRVRRDHRHLRSPPPRSSRRSPCPRWCGKGYTTKFAVGLTAGSSLLGMLIPPSSAARSSTACSPRCRSARCSSRPCCPGILLAVAFAVGVVLMAWLWPSFVGAVRRDAPSEHDDGALGVLAGLVPGGRADRARARRNLRRQCSRRRKPAPQARSARC